MTTSNLTYELTELQLSDDRKGPWCLYVYELDSEFHRGGVWFSSRPKYPEEGEITTAEAYSRCSEAQAEGRQVRICDGGDMLVFHARGDVILHRATFWADVTRG